MKYVDVDNSRKEDQKKVMENIAQADHCPFCLENLKKYHTQEILKDGQYWILTYNQWPYDHTKLHLLAIYKVHATTLAELNPESGKELIEFLAWAEKHFQVPGGGFAMRFGDTNYSAGSVVHLHVQFIVPDIDAPDFEPTRVKIGKSKK